MVLAASFEFEKSHNSEIVERPSDNEEVPQVWIAFSWTLGYETFFMLNSAEHEMCSANKSQITNNCKFFVAEHC